MLEPNGIGDCLSAKGASSNVAPGARAFRELAALPPAPLHATAGEPRSQDGVSVPVTPEERTRVHSRDSAPRKDIIAFGRFRLRATERLLEKDGVRLKVGSRALDILIALVERAPEVVSKRDLLARVWPDLVVEESSLRFHIAVLRKALGDGARYVINVAGRGYCFGAPISRSATKPPSAESLRVERVALLPRQTHNAEATGALAGAVAHDFNNILGAILGYGELAQHAASAEDPMRRYVDNIMIAGLRAKSLVERLLAFTNSNLGDRIPVHAQSVVAEALDLISGSLPSEVRLERELHAGDAAVMGDPTQIHRVVMNLCTNAMQAMKSGGPLTVSLDLLALAEARALATATLSPGEYLRLVVRDSGTGITPEVLERIFEPFFTTKKVGAGTGLGLSLVHCIVSDLGGAVDVESEPGRGSAFTVLLPRHDRASQISPAAEELSRGAGETILLVDDQEPLVRVGEEMLAELGYHPVGFTSSTEALAAFRADPQNFAAVLSDERMPELTGSQLAREFRKLRADIPIIVMSGYGRSTLVVPALSAGANEVIGKPLVMRDIACCLASVLRPFETRS
jgi:signal transduction histidine kinase/ActR/RegA family two-component response regulator